MSVETLHAAEHAAGLAIGMSEGEMGDIAESQQPRVVDLGTIPVRMDNGHMQFFPAVRAIAGPSDAGINKGGTRLLRAHSDIKSESRALGSDMYSKLQLGVTGIDGQSLDGGKTVVYAPDVLSHNETVQLFRSMGGVMLGAGIGGHDKSVPAGDMGTNHTDFMDAYTEAFRDSGDPFYQASITGKSVENGGLAFRPHATGYGVYLAAIEQSKALGMDGPTRITISGAGNVGGYAGYYASHDHEGQFSIRGYSDIGGTLAVTNSDPAHGIVVTEKLMAIMDNPNFRGNKLTAIAKMLERDQPELELQLTDDSSDIMTVPTDIFIPASVRGLINEATAPKLAARGIVEAGNDTITEEATIILGGRHIQVIPGALANIGGVATSMDEHASNILAIREHKTPPTFEEAKKLLEDGMETRFADVYRMAECLQTTDLELAINALVITRKAQRIGIGVYDLAR